MSFSSQVREELLKHHTNTHDEACAELAAFIMFLGKIHRENNGKTVLVLETDNEMILQKVFTLFKKKISIGVGMRDNVFTFEADFPQEKFDWRNQTIYENQECRRAFLRGAYVCAGSMSDPEKSYHLEFDCNNEALAEFVQEFIGAFDIEAKIVERKKYHVVYLKEGSAICDLLNILGAHVALMNFENYRILKEIKNKVNRKVNCETANIAKTVNAATKQVQDIELIKNTIGFGDLQPGLREIAELRLEYHEATLQELGNMLNPPVGKSGVNHRLRKLSEIAEGIREL